MERYLRPPRRDPFHRTRLGQFISEFCPIDLEQTPSTFQSLNSTALPLDMILQPVTPLQDGEQLLPVLLSNVP